MASTPASRAWPAPTLPPTVGLPTLATPLVVVGLLAAVIGGVASAFVLAFSVALYDELTE